MKKAELLLCLKVWASLSAVIFTVAAYPNEGERDRGNDARSTEKPI